MSNVIDLDTIRAAADEEYSSLVVPFGPEKSKQVVFRNVLQLPSEEREEITKLSDDEEISQVALLQAQLRLLASDKGVAEEFINEVGDNLAVLLHVFKSWSKGTQAGEASPSAA